MLTTGLWGKLLTLLFPDPPHIAQFTTLRGDAIMRTAHGVPLVRRAVQCLAPFPYEHAMVRAAIHAAKYHNHTRAATLLGEALAPFVAEELGDQRLMGAFTHPILLPMPLHAARERERGFNQCVRIAVALIDALGDNATRIDTTVLTRTKNTHHQARQHSRAERLKNVHAAFAVSNTAQVIGRDIIILDDVITTGATLKAVHDTLIAAGAHRVLCIATAH